MKNLTLKVAVVALAMFAGFGASAQTTPWTTMATRGDFTRTDTGTVVNNKVTVGKLTPFWVYPSVAYNPSYVAPTNATPFTPVADIIANVVSGFSWYLSVASNGAVMTPANAAKNYIELSFDKVGVQKIAVVEKPTSNVCPGKEIRWDVDVIAVPDATITVVAGGPSATTLGLANLIQKNCWGVAGNNTNQIAFTRTNANEVNPYFFYMDYKVYNVTGLTAGGLLPVDASNNLNTADALVKLPALVDTKVKGLNTTSIPDKIDNPLSTSTTNLLPAAIDFPVQGNMITVYEFDLAGYNAKVSRASDYITMRDNLPAAKDPTKASSYTLYGTAAKYYIVALPLPVTGPIYHIANTFGL